MNVDEQDTREKEIKDFLNAQGWVLEIRDSKDESEKLKYTITAVKDANSIEENNEKLLKALKTVKYRVLSRYIDICYLCGRRLDNDRSRDHIPPKQFYPSVIKRELDDLFTLPTHKDCNLSYQEDEDYFRAALGFLAIKTNTGKDLWKDIIRKADKEAPFNNLLKMVVDVSESKRGKIELLGGKLIHTFDGERVWRIIWKITRGLFFKETGRYLPEDTLKGYISIGYDYDEQPKEYKIINGRRRGQHPFVLDYKYLEHPDIKNVHLWAMLLWNNIIFVLKFNDPIVNRNVFPENNTLLSESPN